MPKKMLSSLDDHLFAALDRLAGTDLTPEQIETEAKRAEAVVKIADQVTENAKTKLVAAKLFAEYGKTVLPMLPQIGPSKEPSNEG